MRLIPISVAKAGYYLADDIKDKNNNVFLMSGTKLTDDLIQKIILLKIQYIHIIDTFSDNEIEKVIKPDLRFKSTSLIHDTISNIEKVINSIDISNFDSDIRDKRAAYLNSINNISNRIIGDVISNTEVLRCLLDIKNCDNRTYNHSINVAMLSLILGLSMELDESTLKDLFIGALLHDFGKIFISQKLLNKNGRLTTSEFETMKSHAIRGYEYLTSTAKISHASACAILQHHEKENGTGYPYGLRRDEIGILGKIVAISDIYDSLTSDKTYRIPMSPIACFDYLDSISETHLNRELVESFIKILVPYPTGSIVLLINSEIAIVEEINPEHFLRPRIKIIESKIDKSRVGLKVNLLEDLTLSILATHYHT